VRGEDLSANSGDRLFPMPFSCPSRDRDYPTAGFSLSYGS